MDSWNHGRISYKQQLVKFWTHFKNLTLVIQIWKENVILFCHGHLYIHSVAKEGEKNQVIYTFEEIVIEKNRAASQMPIRIIPAKVVIYLNLIYFLLIKLLIFIFRKKNWIMMMLNTGKASRIIYLTVNI